jgi:serine/threonine-protein kinase
VAAHLQEQPGDVLGAYALEKCLGEGAMGRVWLGRHLKLGRQAAIKVLKTEHSQDSELVGRFFDEARAVNQINHEHIVAISDFVEELEPARVYCIMEYLPGEALDRRLERDALPLPDSISVMRQVCEALAAAHKLGIVHRDVKPDNIFLSTKVDGSLFAKVLDFGVAKLAPALKRDKVTSTLSGQLVGTPAYMAPEQIVGIEVDASADVYSAGTVLYRLLSGVLPFQDEDFGKLSLAVIKQPPPPLPRRTPTGERIPKELASAVMGALAKESKDRPTMDALVAALKLPEQREQVPFLPLAGAAALIVLAAGLVYFAVRPVAPQPVAQVQAAPAKLTVRSEPPGAVVSRADTGEKLGVTPLAYELPRGTGDLQVRVSLDGYTPVERNIGGTTNTDLDLVLAPVKPAEPPAPVAAPAQAAPAPSRPAKKPHKKVKLSDEGTLDPFGP